jgi:hypothetical protein
MAGSHASGRNPCDSRCRRVACPTPRLDHRHVQLARVDRPPQLFEGVAAGAGDSSRRARRLGQADSSVRPGTTFSDAFSKAAMPRVPARPSASTSECIDVSLSGSSSRAARSCWPAHLEASRFYYGVVQQTGLPDIQVRWRSNAAFCLRQLRQPDCRVGFALIPAQQQGLTSSVLRPWANGSRSGGKP